MKEVVLLLSLFLILNARAGTYVNKYAYGGVLVFTSYTSVPNGRTHWSFSFNDVYTVNTRTLNSTHIEIEISAKTTGFVGFGFGPKYNTVTDSDFVLGGIDDLTNKTYNYDLYGDESSKTLRKDTKLNSDWILTFAFQDWTTHQTKLTYQRLLKTTDPNPNQDIEIQNKEMYILWFIGETDTITTNFTNQGSSMSCNLVRDGKGNANAQKASLVTTLTFILIIICITLNFGIGNIDYDYLT